MKKATRMGGFFHARLSGTYRPGESTVNAPHQRHRNHMTDWPSTDKWAPSITHSCPSGDTHPASARSTLMLPSLGGP